MIIFPLSIPAKIVLIFIAIMLGLIFSMMMWPKLWHKLLGKKSVPVQSPQLQKAPQEIRK